MSLVSMAIVMWVFIINSVACLVQMGINNWEDSRGEIPKRGSIIPNTDQKFLYWPDFYTQLYGDILALPFLQYVFVQAYRQGSVGPWVLICGMAAGAVATIIFLLSCLRINHKPDFAYPAPGRITLAGLSHLPYYIVNWGVATVDAYCLFTGRLGKDLWPSAMIGTVLYLICAAADYTSGNWDSVKWKDRKN